ncbi:MAG: hypothetical protein KGI54_13190 [Pseudomonadota bacterium]|nr:hypothetical protein [Pseudomonadota bacterium]
MARTLREALVAHKVFSTGREGVRMVEQGCILVNEAVATNSYMDIHLGDKVSFKVRQNFVFTFVDDGRTKE